MEQSLPSRGGAGPGNTSGSPRAVGRAVPVRGALSVGLGCALFSGRGELPGT